MSEPTHDNVADPNGQNNVVPTTANNFGPSISDSANSILSAVGSYVGVLIGFGFIVIGIIILIQSNEKVQDAQRKIVGAAAAIKPELAGAAIATNVLTGKKARAVNVQQAMNDPARRARQNAAAAKKAAPKPTPQPKPSKPARQSFSVPVVETRVERSE